MRGYTEYCPTCHKRLMFCFCGFPKLTNEEERQSAKWGEELERAALIRHIRQVKDAGGKVKLG